MAHREGGAHGIPGYDCEDWGSMGEASSRSMLQPSAVPPSDEWVAPMKSHDDFSDGDGLCEEEDYDEGYAEERYEEEQAAYDEAEQAAFEAAILGKGGWEKSRWIHH